MAECTQLHRDGRAHETLLALGLLTGPARGLRRQHDEQRAQPLAAGSHRRGGVGGERHARLGGDALQMSLHAIHALAQRRTAAAHDLLDRLHIRRRVCAGSQSAHPGTVAPWTATMPPAISTYPISSHPARSSSAASSAGEWKRLTELGR